MKFQFIYNFIKKSCVFLILAFIIFFFYQNRSKIECAVLGWFSTSAIAIIRRGITIENTIKKISKELTLKNKKQYSFIEKKFSIANFFSSLGIRSYYHNSNTLRHRCSLRPLKELGVWRMSFERSWSFFSYIFS